MDINNHKSYHKLTLSNIIQIDQSKSISSKLNHSIAQLSKYNNSVYAYSANHNAFLQIDVKHGTIYINPLQRKYHQVKYLSLDSIKTYFLVDSYQVYDLNHSILSQSNQKATYTGQITASKNHVLFVKYHKNHMKYSLNLLTLQYNHKNYHKSQNQHQSINNQKKILKLFDNTIQNLSYFYQMNLAFYQNLNENIEMKYHQQKNKKSSNNKNSEISESFSVKKVYLQNPEQQFQILKKGTYLSDSYNIYLFDDSKKGTVSIYDQKLKKPSVNWKYLNLSEKNQPLINQKPFKIQNFKHKMILASNKYLKIYDVRKLVQPYCVQKFDETQNPLTDFLYQPNLQKIFVATSKSLKTYKTS